MAPPTVFDRSQMVREACARASAAVFLPELLARTAAHSVLHLGCGTGAWLAAARDCGVEDVVGVDDIPWPPEAGRVPRDLVRRADFGRELDLGRRFDLALCIDLAPRLPRSDIDAVAATLAKHADVIAVATAAPSREGHASAFATSLARHGLRPVTVWPQTMRAHPAAAPWHARDLVAYATAEVSVRLGLPPAPPAPPTPHLDLDAETAWRPQPPVRLALGDRLQVAVVVPCHNYARFLPDAVASVAGQTWRNLQCVIVDDGSTDDSSTLARELIGLHRDLDLRLVQQRNEGVAQARNRGVRATDAPLVMQLDADDRLAPRAVERLVAAFLADATLDIAHGDGREFGAQDRPLHAVTDVTLANLRRRNCLNYCALVRRSSFTFLGGYRDIRGGYDDWDLWLSAAAAGCRFGHVAEPLLLYRRHGNSLMDRERAREPVLRAQVVANHPDVYSPRQVTRALEILARDAAGLPLGSPVQQAWELLRQRRLRRAWRTLRPVTT